MWHKIVGAAVALSLDSLPADVAALPPGAVLNAGWRQGRPQPVPFHDPETQDCVAAPWYDAYSGQVTESWAVVPRNQFVLMGSAMLARREEAKLRRSKGKRY